MLSFHDYKPALLTLIFFLASPVRADVLDRTYTFKDLERLWQNTLAVNEAQAWDAYNRIFEVAAATGPTSTQNEDERLTKTAFANSIAGANASGKVQKFLVEPLPSAYAALLVSREIALNMFMQKTESSPFSAAADKDGNLTGLAQQTVEKAKFVKYKAQANAELFLLNIIRYREASTLGHKCIRLDAAKAGRDALIMTNLPDLETGGIKLAKTASTVQEAYATILADRLVCKATPISGLADQQQKVKNRLDQQILAGLRTIQDEVLKPISDDQQQVFADLNRNIKSVNPRHGEIFDFENLVRNTAASINLVGQDGFKVGALLTRAEAIPDARIKKIAIVGSEPAVLEDARVAQRDLLKDFKDFLESLEALSLKVPELAPCRTPVKNLSSVLPDDIKKWRITTQQASFGGLSRSLDLCLAAINSRLTALDTHNAETLLFDRFRDHVNALSEEILSE